MKKIVVIVSTLLLGLSLILIYNDTFADAEGSCEIQCSLGAENVLFVDNLGTYTPEFDIHTYAGNFMDPYGETYTGIKFNLSSLRIVNLPVSNAKLKLHIADIMATYSPSHGETADTHGLIPFKILGSDYDDWSLADMTRIKAPQPADVTNISLPSSINPLDPYHTDYSIEIDVTDFINSQLASTTNDYATFIVKRDLSLTSHAQFYFTMSATGENQPALLIERPQNTPPTLLSSNITGYEDTTLNLTKAAFLNAYHDAENDPLAHIEITSLPSTEAGKLMLKDKQAEAIDIAIGQTFIQDELESIQFVPNEDFYGTATFSWQASDGKDLSSEASTMTITIENVNDKPEIGTLSDQETNEDTTITIPISVTDKETAIEQLNFTVSSTDQSVVPNSQIIVDKANRTIVITPAEHSFGAADITISVSDGEDEAETTFTLTVISVNDAPIGKNEALSIAEDSSYNGTLYGIDVESASLSYSIVSGPTKGEVTLDNQTGEFLYKSNADQYGLDSFTYKVFDGEVDSIAYTISITITPVNDAPTLAIIADQVIDEDEPVVISFVANDVDHTHSQLTYEATSNNIALIPTQNITIDSQAQQLTITPVQDKFGTAVVTLTVRDVEHLFATVTFSVKVNAVNDSPTANNAAVTVNEDDTVIGVLLGDDVDGDDISYIIEDMPAKGTVVVTDRVLGEFSYSPDANQNGSDSFTFKTFDGLAYSSAATVTITIIPINDVPTLAAIADQTTDEDAELTVPFTASDVETALADLFVTAASSDEALIPSSVIAIDKVAQTLKLLPAPNESGTATITLTVTDTDGGSVVQSFTVTVNTVNDPPTLAAIADQITDEDTPKTISYAAADLESAATDLIVTVTSSNENLVVSHDINIDTENKQLTLNPIADAFGTVIITVTVLDEDGGSTAQAFTLTVNPVNDLPQLAPIADQTTAEDSKLTVQFNASDIETTRADLVVTATSSNEALIPSSAIVVDKASQTLTFTPAANESGTATITVTVIDEDGASAVQAFTLTVNPVNDIPQLAPIADQATDEDTDLVVQFIASDVETARADLNITIASSNEALIPASAIVVDKAAQTLTFTPAIDQNGIATITVTVTDEDGASAVQAFTLTVNSVNDLPQLAAIADQVTDEDTELSVKIAASDIETALADLNITVTSSNKALILSHAISVDLATGALTLKPATHANGTTVITVTVTDEAGGAVNQSFIVTVNAINDAPVLANILNQVININSDITIPFQASDVETELGNLIITATSSNEALLLSSNIAIDKTTQAILLQPEANMSGNTTITLTVADEEGLSVSTTFDVQVKAAGSNIQPQPVAVPDHNISIVLDGQPSPNYAKLNIQQAGERSSATVELNTNHLISMLKQGNHKTLSLSLTQPFADVQLNIDGVILEELTKQQGSIFLNTYHGSYSLDLEHLNLQEAMTALPSSIDLSDIYLSLEISKVDEQEQEKLAQLIKESGYQLVSSILNFSIKLHYENTSIELNRFTNYLKRTISLGEDIDPSRITTGIVFTENGEIHHVPTTIIVDSNKYFAQINAMSNSYYGVVWSPKTFSDVEQHASKESINDMASRLIINGMTDSIFAPDDPITRAQFSAILTRGLGLIYEKQQAQAKLTFHDVLPQSWYGDAVRIASSYGLITGYEDGSFRPNHTISRMEAMVMLARAMKLVNINTGLADKEANQLLQPFSDQDSLSKWASEGVALNIKYGLIEEQVQSLKPLVNITRAETATMLRKLLQLSELIN